MQFKDPVKFKEKNTLHQSYEGITGIFSRLVIQINNIAWAAFHIIVSTSKGTIVGEVTGSLDSIS